MSITVNGKSDGNTVGDYSNMVLSGVLPYLWSPKVDKLEVAVVGLGTGMTSGALTAADEVREVTTIEISSAVIDAAPLFGAANFNVAHNPKSRIVQADAFRFLARRGRRFDVIISEPSNPWISGVDALFTPEFYDVVSNALTHDGICFQWVQAYDVNNGIVAAIVRNALDEFEHATLFTIGSADLGILASHAPLAGPHVLRRFAQAGVRRALEPLGLDDPALLSFIEIYRTPHLHVIAAGAPEQSHTIEMPWIGPAADHARFLHETIHLADMTPPGLRRHLWNSRSREQSFLRWMQANAIDLAPWCKPSPERFAADFLCQILQPMLEDYQRYQGMTEPGDWNARLAAYTRLRERGRIAFDAAFLNETRAALDNPPAPLSVEQMRGLGRQLVMEYAHEAQWMVAIDMAIEFQARGAFSQQDTADLQNQMRDLNERLKQWQPRLAITLEGAASRPATNDRTNDDTR